MLTSSSVPCICSATPKIISANHTEFQQRWRTIKSSWNLDVANQQFEELCQRFANSYPTFIAELRKKRSHYLAFFPYPESIRRTFSTTNVVEAINGQLEIMRRNSGGYFQSEDILKLKLGLVISSLEENRWRSPGRTRWCAGSGSVSADTGRTGRRSREGGVGLRSSEKSSRLCLGTRLRSPGEQRFWKLSRFIRLRNG
jgi:Transposase, Mutator family